MPFVARRLLWNSVRFCLTRDHWYVTGAFQLAKRLRSSFVAIRLAVVVRSATKIPVESTAAMSESSPICLGRVCGCSCVGEFADSFARIQIAGNELFGDNYYSALATIRIPPKNVSFISVSYPLCWGGTSVGDSWRFPSGSWARSTPESRCDGPGDRWRLPSSWRL